METAGQRDDEAKNKSGTRLRIPRIMYTASGKRIRMMTSEFEYFDEEEGQEQEDIEGIK